MQEAVKWHFNCIICRKKNGSCSMIHTKCFFLPFTKSIIQEFAFSYQNLSNISVHSVGLNDHIARHTAYQIHSIILCKKNGREVITVKDTVILPKTETISCIGNRPNEKNDRKQSIFQKITLENFKKWNKNKKPENIMK